MATGTRDCGGLQKHPEVKLNHKVNSKPTSLTTWAVLGISSSIHAFNSQHKLHQTMTKNYSPIWYSCSDSLDGTMYNQMLIF